MINGGVITISDKLENNISFYIKPIINHIWFVLSFVAVFSLAIYFYFANLPPIYQSTATVMVAQNTPNQMLDSQLIFVTQQISETFARVARSEELTKQVSTELSINSINNDNITILVIPRTQLMKISVKADSPATAALIANKLVDVLSLKIDKLQQSISPNSRAILEIVENASADHIPIYPKMNLIAIIAVFAGLLIVLLIVYFIELFDTTIRDKEDIANVLPNIPILASFPFIRHNTDKLAINQMRVLRNNIIFNKNKSAHCLTVASFYAQEGKTYILSRLAMFLARSKKNVLLVDADFTKLGLTAIAKLTGKPGLFDYLASSNNESKELNLSNWYNSDGGGKVDIIPAGNIVSSKREEISSSGIEYLISDLRQKYNYDFILIDTTALSESPDAFAIAPRTDGIMLVIESGKINHSQLENIKEEAELENFKIFGGVINKAKRRNII